MGDTPLGIKLLGMGLAGMPVNAQIASIDDTGRACVVFFGATAPVPARCAVPQSGVPPRSEIEGAEVLIVFEDGDARRPIITGFIRETLWSQAAPVEVQPKVLIEGEEEVSIRCGKSSINMTADGRVVIKGTRVTSRATEANKVRGAVVLIN